MSPSPQHTALFTPARPVPAVVAAVIRSGDVLLVRRAHEPNSGKWALPGGKIEFGESIETAVLRELFEETLIQAKVCQVFNAVDIFDKNENGALRHHFILIAVLCRWVSGEPQARDDALDARWFRAASLASSDLVLCAGVAQLVQQAAMLASPQRNHLPLA